MGQKENTLTDEQLAEQVALREESAERDRAAQEAFRVLYDRHARLLLAFLATRVPRNELDDLGQMVWQRVWKSLPTQFKGGSFKGWIYEIARNLIIDFRRKRTMSTVDDDVDAPDPGSVRVRDVEYQSDAAEALHGCLAKLGESQARLVKARLEGMSYDDICAELQLTQAQAHKQFFLAKQQLADCVKRALP